MKQPRINRRQFFKLSALGAGSLALAPLVAAPSKEARADADAPQLAIPQPTFNPIASTTEFGPPTDISAGWDGTLWAIDGSGAPHLYDPTQDVWLPYGKALDATAWVGTSLYWFSGDEVAGAPFGGNATAPQPIATVFPKLPDSFKLSVNGAANVNGTLVLFNGGRYVPADGSASPTTLTSLTNWPQTPAWVDGVIDAVHTDGTSTVLLFRGEEFITANLQTKAVTTNPAPISSYAPWQNRIPSAWAATGFDAAFTQGNETAIYNGTAIAVFTTSSTSPATPRYLPTYYPTWPAAWHPVLNHAPSGRVGNLWCAAATAGQVIVRHDGERWNLMPGNGNTAAVGQDGTVMVTSGGGLYRWNGTSFDGPLGNPGALVQVSLGNANTVWVRDGGNTVLSFNPSGNTFTPATQIGSAIHIAANTDGTLWHCKQNDPNAYRFLSESNVQQAGIPVKQGIVTAVQRVAATGFGAAHLLVQQSSGPQVYRYDSPYVFKSQRLGPNVYGPFRPSMVLGLGNVYFVTATEPVSPNPVQWQIVALNVQTGALVTSTATSTLRYSGLVFDPLHDLVYATSASGLLALDARDLTKIVWRFDTTTPVDATPMLNGTTLAFGDRTAMIYAFDTATALAAATGAPPQTVAPKWTWRPPTYASNDRRVTTPLMQSGRVYAAVWDLPGQSPNGGDPAYFSWWASCNATDGSDGQVFELYAIVRFADIQPDLLLTQPVSGPMVYGAPSFFVNCGNAALLLNSGGGFNGFQLPGGDGDQITTGFGYDQESEALWFGTGFGTGNCVLYALNTAMQPINHTPYRGGPNQQINTTPVVYKDANNQKTILFGIFDSSAPYGSLYGFDPDNGNVASLPTGVTMITAMSGGVSNGVLYVSGAASPSGPSGPNDVAQAFGIRVDKLPQALRDFVIESQMMQDPDPSSPNSDPANNIPPSFARYQTHLTIVDAQKNPLPHEPVKIWCDTPNATIAVDGTPFTVGPDDGSYAAVKTGSDGALVITMDATDYFAPTLRVWASFMNPYERIVVNPDAEFHQRVMTAHAQTDPSKPDYADPATINLQTVTNYKGASLFTADEKSQNPSQPANVANSIQQVNKGLGLSTANGNSKGLYRKLMRAMGVKHKNQRISVRFVEGLPTPGPSPTGTFRLKGGEVEGPDKYLAYADLPGATSFPTNIPAARPATITQAIGLSFSRPNGDATKAPTFTALSHTDARAAIDALPGTPWQPTDQQGGASRIVPMRTFGIWQDFWNWLKRLVDKVLQCILSIAEDIVVGIQYFLGAALKVFKAIIKVLEDVFPFLGSFFKMLEKAIDDVMMALSVLFNFGEIIKTHDILKTQVMSLKDTVKTALTTSIPNDVNTWFTSAEITISNGFKDLRKQLTPNMQISNVRGMGTTAHTAFQAKTGAVGPTSDGSSNAVQCCWGLQKLKTNLPKGSASGANSRNDPAPHTRPANVDDVISGFINGFIASLSNDPTLSAAFTQLKTDTHRLLKPSSAGQFFSTALDVLLDLLETLIESMVAVGKAFIEGALGVMGAIFDAVWGVNGVGGFLNTALDIPVIGWLYQTLFKEPLTILNLLMLVTAIPVTVIYRVVKGQYPSQAVTQAVGAQSQFSQASTKLPIEVMEVMGLMSGVLSIVSGFVSAYDDFLVDEAPDWVDQLLLGLGLVSQVPGYPLFSSDTPTGGDYTEYAFNVAMAAFGVFYLQEDAEFETLSVIGSMLNLTLLVVTIAVFIADGQTDGASDAGLAEGIIGTIPGMLNAVIYLPEPAALIVAIVDGVAGLAVGGIQMVLAMLTAAPAPGTRRLYFPFVPVSDGLQGAPHPMRITAP